MGIDEGFEVWEGSRVFRIGELVTGVGPHKRSSFQYNTVEFRRLGPLPPALQMGFKRRMVGCLGSRWEDILRPDLDGMKVRMGSWGATRGGGGYREQNKVAWGWCVGGSEAWGTAGDAVVLLYRL